MRDPVLRALVPVITLIAGCGGSNTPTAPSATLLISGAPTTFALGSSQQLRATPSTSSVNCSSVQWTSSAPAILSISPDGLATAQSPGDVDISAMCGGAGATVHARVSSVREVHIVASQVTPLRVGGSERLTSSALSGTPPRFNDCVASGWQSSRPDVASLEALGTGATVTARAAGETTITATCDGVTASIAAQVTAGWTVSFSMNEVPPVSLSIVGTVEVLTGPHAGTKAQAMSVGIARLLDMEFPFRIRLSAAEYQDAEFEVTSDNVSFYPQYSVAEIHLQMKPLPPPPGTEEFTVRLGPTEQRSWSFPLRSAGTFSALVRFELDYNDWLNLELRCDGKLLASGRRGSGQQPPLSATVSGPCAGEVKVEPSIRYPSVALRLRVTYPH